MLVAVLCQSVPMPSSSFRLGVFILMLSVVEGEAAFNMQSSICKALWGFIVVLPALLFFCCIGMMMFKVTYDRFHTAQANGWQALAAMRLWPSFTAMRAMKSKEPDGWRLSQLSNSEDGKRVDGAVEEDRLLELASNSPGLCSITSLEPAILAEAWLVALSPLWGFIVGLATSFLTRVPHRRPKVPTWSLVLLLLVVARVKYAEVGLLRAADLQQGDAAINICTLMSEDFAMSSAAFPPSLPSLTFTLSALEVLDASSDGMAIASASLAGPEVHSRFVASFRNGSLAFIAPVIDRLGIAGIMSANQLFASFTQATLAKYSPVVAADLGGLGALSKRAAGIPGIRISPTWQMNVVNARVFWEAAPQMVWQTSLIMAQGHGLLAQPTLALSVALSFLSMTAKVLGVITSGFRQASSWVTRAIALLSAVPIIIYLAYIATRLYMIEACPSHSWGITTGCVTF